MISRFKKVAFILVIFISIVKAHAGTLIIGDSLTASLGKAYQKKHPAENITLKYSIGSGLIASKKTDWIKSTKLMDFNEYKKVIVSIGTNDFYNTSEDLYKVKSLVENIRRDDLDKEILWILPPPVRDDKINNQIRHVREAIIEQSLISDFLVYNPQSSYGKKYVQSKNGHKIRTADGVHYTNYGAEMIVSKIDF